MALPRFTLAAAFGQRRSRFHCPSDCMQRGKLDKITHTSNAFSMAGGSNCSSSCALCRDFRPLALSFNVAVRTETRRQKRRTSKHRKRRNRRDEDEIRAWGSENVNNRAIAVRLHAQMIYNNNNQHPWTFDSLSAAYPG